VPLLASNAGDDDQCTHIPHTLFILSVIFQVNQGGPVTPLILNLQSMTSRTLQQTYLADKHSLWWPSALEPAAGYYTSHQHQCIGLFETSTKDVPVSMSGRLVADDSTSEELL